MKRLTKTFRRPEFPFYRRSAVRHTSIVLCFSSSVIRRRRPIKNATNQTGLQVVDANETEFICNAFGFLRQSVGSGWSNDRFQCQCHTVPDDCLFYRALLLWHLLVEVLNCQALFGLVLWALQALVPCIFSNRNVHIKRFRFRQERKPRAFRLFSSQQIRHTWKTSLPLPRECCSSL